LIEPGNVTTINPEDVCTGVGFFESVTIFNGDL
jgi:hypothetical protein